MKLLVIILALVAYTQAAPQMSRDMDMDKMDKMEGKDMFGRLIHGAMAGLSMTVTDMKSESDEMLMNPMLDMMDPMNWMMKMMPAKIGYKMYKMQLGFCYQKCTSNSFDCPGGMDSDLTDRSSPCRTCILECNACSTEYHKKAYAMDEYYKKMVMKKMTMSDDMDMDMEKDMEMEMEKAMDMTKKMSVGVDDYLSIGCERYQPTERDLDDLMDYAIERHLIPMEKKDMVKKHMMLSMKKNMLLMKMVGDTYLGMDMGM